MKDPMDSVTVGRSREATAENFGNRKLIRPAFNRGEHPRPEQRPDGRGERPGKKAPPPDQTHAENFYYQKQMQVRTPMVVVLRDGEEIHGVIEWYDKTCIKVNRDGQPNLLIYKSNIRYLYKEGEGQK